jgi:hypothetical protein
MLVKWLLGDSGRYSVDGHPGLMGPFCGENEAFVFTKDRAFGFAVWRPELMSLLEEFVSTVDLP